MAFTVQTNPPTVGANAYITVAFLREYHLERGRDLTATDDDACEVAIILATQYLDVRFEYVGLRQTAEQDTEWPRSSAFNNRGTLMVGIPTAVQRATAEYAYRALTDPLLADPERDASGMAVKSKSETVGPISERVEYVTHQGFVMPAYPLADKLLISLGLVYGATGPNGLSSGNLGRA